MEISIHAAETGDTRRWSTAPDTRREASQLAQALASARGPFTVSISIASNSFAGEAARFEDLVIDLLANRELIRKGHSYSFFLQEEPLFQAEKDGEWFVATYYRPGRLPKRPEKIELREHFNDTITYLDAFCGGLVDGLAQTTSWTPDEIISAVERDLRSDNRRSFLCY